MKKLLLSAVFAMVALTTTFAAQLNPFAYGLSSSLSADQSTLTVYYSLNATATGVKVLVMNGDVVVKEVDCNAQKTLAGGAALSRGEYKVVIETSEFPLDTDLTWKVEVKGTSVAEPTQVEDDYSFYCPQGLAIDKDPNSNYFGRILVSEAMQAVPASGYISSGKGAGLYVFNPDFTTDGVVHKGGNNFTRILATNGYQPWRVKISDDGRIFVSSLDLNGVAVWEVSKDLNTWTPVISGTNDATDYTIKKNGAFFAGPNCAMDVIGSGATLKLLLFSTSKRGIAYNSAGYRLDEYALGTETTFTGTPKNIISGGGIGSTHNYADVVYDGNGGYWYGGSRGTGNEINLVHIKSDGTTESADKTINLYGGAGILIHNGMLFKGNNILSTATDGKFGVYTIGKNAAGEPTLTNKWTVVSKGFGRNHNQFAVDYADNLYVVGNSGEKIIAFALPYDKTRITPAATKYTFEITKPNYDHPENHLAPFAYDLRKTIEGDGRTKLHFMLNAHARKVQVVLIDETKEDGDPTKEIILREYPNAKSEYKDFIAYHPQGYGTVITTEDVDTLGLEYGKNYSWRVDVWGEEVLENKALKCAKSYSFYCPTAVDIDNNPNNPTFGTIFTNEALHEVKGESGYMGSGYGAGLYAFTADFKPIKNGSEPGFNGGNEFMNMRPGYKEVKDIYKAYTPRRIRVSEDGRIFVTSLNTNGTYLWEVTPEKFNEWTPVFKGASVNANNEILDGSGNFIVGPNCGFDVKGRDEHLQLMMYSVNKQGIDAATMSGFKCAEYNLGQEKSWSTEPSKMWISGKYAINCLGTQVEYDNEGGLWIASHRDGIASDANPGLVHINANGVEDLKLVWNNVRCAGIRFNKDFTKLVIAGINGGSLSSTKNATIYTISKNANGAPVLTEDLVIDMSLIGNNLNDFAWDYAGNLYVCGNSLEKVAAYVMPRSANDKVSTPARDEFVVNLTQPVPRIVAYNLTYRPNGATKNYDFSFYANTQPTSATIRFYKNSNPKTVLWTYAIASPVKGNNTVSIPMVTLDEQLNNEYDITWEVELSAPESQVFGKIYKSGELNTAYATIDNNPESDYFGQIYAANQQNHPFTNSSSGGNVYVWAPGSSGTDIYHTTKEAFLPTLPSGQKGLSQAFRPCVAPDGKVYLTDNGVNGGLYVLDPKNYTTTSFFAGCTQSQGNADNQKSRWFSSSSEHVGSPSSGAHIYWTGGNTAKLFLTRTECYEQSNIGTQGSTLSRHNEGYFTYQLTQTDGLWQHNWQGSRTKVQIDEENLYQTDFAIVGTSHGAWLCQHRYNDKDVIESRSLMFYDNNGVRQYCSDDNDIIYGSAGAALAVNKEETILAMASGLAGIMFFDISWNGDKPTLKYKYTSALNDNYVLTSLNFDYAGNLVATVGDTYDDRTDKHRMVVFTMPKANNTITVPARFNQRVASLYADEREDVHFDQVETNAYQTVDVYRPLVAGMYNTICLPFSLSTLDGTPYQGATVMKFTNATYDDAQQVMNFNFTKVSFQGADILEAGVPYLIQPAKDIEGVVRFTSVVWAVIPNVQKQFLYKLI